ncbi:MAG TPA: hypothetical protein ENK98_02280 [Epsilonproteobacteria bacterium]|nr:hypothetical protein [Campylobacterota bacterium]
MAGHSKKDEYFAALCINYLEDVEKLTGKTNLIKLIESSNNIHKFADLIKIDINSFKFLKDKNPKYLEIALFPNLNKIKFKDYFDKNLSYEALGYSPEEIEELRVKSKEYHAKKRAEKEKLKTKITPH